MAVDSQTKAKLERQMPDLLAGMRQDLQGYPLRREFEVSECEGRYAMETYAFAYYEDVFPDLRDKIRVLLNHGLITDIAHDRTRRYAISEELAEMLGDPTAEACAGEAAPTTPQLRT